MLVLSILLAADASGFASNLSPSTNSLSIVKARGFLDPVKEFYNKKVVEGALTAVQPALKGLISKSILDYEKDAVARAPEWLRLVLQDVLGLNPLEPYVDKGIYNELFKILYKYFQPILQKWTLALNRELNLTLTRFETNLNEEINKKVRDTLYWRRLIKRDNWYHQEIEKVIKMISNIINKAVVTTAVQSRDDYGNKIGEHAKEVINWFLPDYLKIHDLKYKSMKMPQIADPNNMTDVELLWARDYLRNKLKELIIALQKIVQNSVNVQFQNLGTIITTQIEGAVRQKAKDLLPFY